MKQPTSTQPKEIDVISKKQADCARQGDVWVERIDALPEGLESTKRDEHDRIVLAYGELSGHAHAVREKHVTGFSFRGEIGEVDFIEVGGSGAFLYHEYISGKEAEHKPVALSPGIYKVMRQREYHPQAIRRAVD